MQIVPPPPLRHSISSLASGLGHVADGLADGARILRDTELSGDDWRAAFDGAIKRSGAAWREPWRQMAALQAAAGVLRPHPASIAARELVDQGVQQVHRGFDQIARGMMRLPADITVDDGVKVLRAIANIADRMVAAVGDASDAVRALTHPADAIG